jgi:hypothetical protein
MNKNKRHKISLLFLLVYVPVAMGLSFFHNHGVPSPAEKQQVSAHDANAVPIAKIDLVCVTCKFFSSHSSVIETSSRASFDFSFITTANSSANFLPFTLLLLSDRAPPFLA